MSLPLPLPFPFLCACGMFPVFPDLVGPSAISCSSNALARPRPAHSVACTRTLPPPAPASSYKLITNLGQKGAASGSWLSASLYNCRLAAGSSTPASQAELEKFVLWGDSIGGTAIVRHGAVFGLRFPDECQCSVLPHLPAPRVLGQLGSAMVCGCGRGVWTLFLVSLAIAKQNLLLTLAYRLPNRPSGQAAVLTTTSEASLRCPGSREAKTQQAPVNYYLSPLRTAPGSHIFRILEGVQWGFQCRAVVYNVNCVPMPRLC